MLALQLLPDHADRHSVRVEQVAQMVGDLNQVEDRQHSVVAGAVAFAAAGGQADVCVAQVRLLEIILYFRSEPSLLPAAAKFAHQSLGEQKQQHPGERRR